MAKTPVTFQTDTDICGDVGKFVQSLVDQHHPTLAHARFAVVAATRQPEKKPCRVFTPDPYGKAADVDLVLVFDATRFGTATDAVISAWLDNALAGWEGADKEGKEGESARHVYQRAPGITVHPEVIERHGPVLQDWKDVGEAFQQMPLDLDKAA